MINFFGKAIAFIAKFIVGYGSPLVFGAVLWTAIEGWKGSIFGQWQTSVSIDPNWFSTGNPIIDLNIVIWATIAYLWAQGIAAAWGEIGSDRAVMFDTLFSMVPFGVLLVHTTNGGVNVDYAWIVGAIIAYDLVVNTKILVKVSRLTSELASAKG